MTGARSEGSTPIPSWLQSQRLLSGSFMGEMYLMSMPWFVQWDRTVLMYSANASTLLLVMFQPQAAPLPAIWDGAALMKKVMYGTA